MASGPHANCRPVLAGLLLKELLELFGCTFGTSRTWGSRYSTHGTAHEQNDGSFLPRQDRRPTKGCRSEIQTGKVRFECVLPDGTQSDHVLCDRSGGPMAGHCQVEERSGTMPR